MKKALIFCMMLAMVIAVGYGASEAAVTGACTTCHTMHNSQNNAPNAVDETGAASATSFGHLTKSNCEGCHNGVGLPAAGAPNVFGAAMNAATAGGTFNQAVITTPAQAHNVSDITWAAPEVALAGATPGADAAESHAGIPAGAAQLTCAGTAGCHGSHDVAGSDAGITGYHHAATTPYRFLTFYDGATHTDIDGDGAADWEAAIMAGGAGQHNLYVAGDGAGDFGATPDTISALCSMCHGNFHGTADIMSTVWTRHPTDASIPGTYTPTVDYVQNPFGFTRAEITGQALTPAGVYTATNAQVVCVSCHRAHGTDQPDILRFNMADMSAGGGNNWGCLGCHNAQR